MRRNVILVSVVVAVSAITTVPAFSQVVIYEGQSSDSLRSTATQNRTFFTTGTAITTTRTVVRA